ncbi:MAG: sensor histidine kinase [Anaerolineae bacterium]|nr:sensor histidine kinase [Anaerolineae bacterium]
MLDNVFSVDGGLSEAPKLFIPLSGGQTARLRQHNNILKQVINQGENMLGVGQSFLFLKQESQAELAFHWASNETNGSGALRKQAEALARQVTLPAYPLPKPDVVRDGSQLLAVPLYLRRQVIGAWVLVCPQERSPLQVDTGLLNLLVNCIAVVLENFRLKEEILVERGRAVEIENQVRKKLADGLHDGPTQLLSAILMHLELCALLVDKDLATLSKELIETKNIAKQAEHQLRTLLFELRPLILETKGLVAAIQSFLERRQNEVTRQTNFTLKIEPHSPDGAISRLEIQVEAALFAIVQEAVNNAIKYAQATNITVYLKETPSNLCVMVTDNGEGFKIDEVMAGCEQRNSLGLVNIRERAELIGGELTVKSIPGRGTFIVVCLPRTKEKDL